MQILWYLPSLLVGIITGIQSGYWQLALLSTLMVSAMVITKLIKNRYPKFESGARIDISLAGVAIANRVLPRWPIFWKSEWSEIILEKINEQSSSAQAEELLGEISANNFSMAGDKDGVRFWLGISKGNSLQLDMKNDGPHLMIVGPTGSGKSELLNLILLSALSSQKLKLALFDFKGGAALEKFQEAAIGLATDLSPSVQLELWQLLAQELLHREELFAEIKVSGIEGLLAKGERMPRLVVVVDEFAAALSSSALAQTTLENICARGRSLGIHLIAASQTLSGIPRSMLTNLRTRIAMESSDPIDLVQIGINPSKDPTIELAGFGSGWLVRSNQKAMPFNFPLGIRPKLLPVRSEEESEPARPARSQFLRQKYLDLEQEMDPKLELSSTPDLKLLSRMARLRS